MKIPLFAIVVFLMFLSLSCFGGSDSSTDPAPPPRFSPEESATVPAGSPSAAPTPTMDQNKATIESIIPSPAYEGDVVTFKGIGDNPGQIKGYKWSIDGRGPIAYDDSFVSSVVTEMKGTHTIVFEVQYLDDSWSSPARQELKVLPRPPSAAFTAQPTSGNNPLTVDFTDTTNKKVTSWLWDFGDGFTSKIQNPSHTYVAAGRYQVTLTVEGPDGTDTEIKEDLIEVIDVEFTATPTTGYKPLEVHFTDQSRNNVINWSWTFGDGDISNQQNPMHTYTSAGVYTVTLMVVGQSNATVSESKENFITVLEPPPVADFLYHSSTYVGFEEYFKDTSDGVITSWIWEFGDGSVSYEQNPNHSYVYDGTYTVRLTVTGPGGTDFVEKTIEVEELD